MILICVYLCKSAAELLFAECVATEEMLTKIHNRIVQRLAGIARSETEFQTRLGTVQIPVILRHLDFTRMHRRREVPLLKE